MNQLISEGWHYYGMITLRILTSIPLLLAITLFMGKRVVGEMPVFDFLIIITLGALVGTDITDPRLHHMPTIYAIMLVGLLQRIVSHWVISSRKVGRLFTFEPTVVVYKGKFLKQNMKKIRYPIDNILVMLREQKIFDLSEVELAILEPSGHLSVKKVPEKEAVTREEWGITGTQKNGVAFPVILEGEIQEAVLKYLGVDQTWIKQELTHKGVQSIDTVFFASVDARKRLSITLNSEPTISPPPFLH
ncbi:DUF421 domain-containing protein [Desmospora activa]|uniref:Uncharacterized membrane protein YcaP (DUF421 family) n=1 Tax=Desmospora activa DSM 45169 TaxID=1121389 RepID=A0A2T4Z3R5_9BACL|nr:DUF421 domain-containing protein [Desmospora activa]PTM56522.1 uncharacterized membrane protein YcaP (DUF421 family) [Desmospora activa DSM 45169]